RVGGRVSEDEQQSCVVGLMAPGVFHCQARFSHTAKAVDRLASNNGCGSAWGSHEPLMQVGQKRLAPLEVGAETEVREILGLAGYCTGLGKADRGNFITQIIQRLEIFAFVLRLPEPIAVFLL